MGKNIELAAHPLFQTTFEKNKPYLISSVRKLKKLSQKTGEIRLKEKTPLSEYEYYNVTVFKKSGTLLQGITQLEEINNFIKRFPSPKTYKKEGVTHYRWIEYHYSYYIITATSLLDFSLILTNVVFRLGNPERLCKLDLIKNNEWIKKSKIDKRLQVLEKIIDRHRKTRNFYIHRGETPDIRKIFQSELLDYLKLFDLASLSPEFNADKKTIDFAFKLEIHKICTKLEKEINELKQTIYKLFDGLLPIYKSVAKTLQP